MALTLAEIWPASEGEGISLLILKSKVSLLAGVAVLAIHSRDMGGEEAAGHLVGQLSEIGKAQDKDLSHSSQ
jgi:hypothetical protein